MCAEEEFLDDPIIPKIDHVHSKREGIKFPSSLTAMKREDLISAHTRSKAHLPSTQGEAKGEGAQGEETTAEGGDTEDEID